MLYLIDGDSLLYRAAFAIPRLTNDAGLPINALHGFTVMLRILLRERTPTHMAVAFTADPPLRRHKIDPDYKIHHYEHPEDIKLQIPYAMRIAEALGARAFRERGLEADDVIATLLHAHADMSARIVSSDRDFFQLVSATARLLTPVKGVSTLAEFGPAEVEARTGVRPEQIPDFKALVGDASDDIIGVPGIGPKTAAALLRPAGTVEALFDGFDSLPQTARLKLYGTRARVLRNKKLATLHPVPMRTRITGLALRAVDAGALRRLADELGMDSLRPE